MLFASHWLIGSKIIYIEVLVTLKNLLGLEERQSRSDSREIRSLWGDPPSVRVQIEAMR